MYFNRYKEVWLSFQIAGQTCF